MSDPWKSSDCSILDLSLVSERSKSGAWDHRRILEFPRLKVMSFIQFVMALRAQQIQINSFSGWNEQYIFAAFEPDSHLKEGKDA